MYHDENKVVIATPNVEDLPRAIAKETSDCVICQDEIMVQQEMFHVSCCDKNFHANPSECVGGTVQDWLKTSRQCPLCKNDVVIEKHLDNRHAHAKKQKH